MSTKSATHALMNYVLNSDNVFKSFGKFVTRLTTKSSQVLPDEPKLPNNPPYMSLRGNLKRTREDENENIVDINEPPKKIGGATNEEISENLLKLYNSLPNFTNLEDEIQIPDNQYSDGDNNDVFKNNNICFHPLLPLYVITQSYYSTITNQNIVNSIDFELFVNYFTFLQKIKNTIVFSYSGANNTNKNKMDCYAVGIGLKQLLFISYDSEEGYNSCLNVLNTTNDVYSTISSFTNTLAYGISGKIMLSEIDIQNGPIYLESELFKNFAKELDINSIFSNISNYETFNIEDFIKEVFKFSIELGEQIVSDRNGVTPRPFQKIMGSRPSYSPIEGITSEELAEKAKISNMKYQENIAKENKPQIKKGIFTGKDLFTYSDGDKSNMVFSSSSKSSVKSKGGNKGKSGNKNKSGKKTRKNRRNKHRVTKRKYSNGKQSIKAKNTRKHKNMKKHKKTRNL